MLQHSQYRRHCLLTDMHTPVCLCIHIVFHLETACSSGPLGFPGFKAVPKVAPKWPKSKIQCRTFVWNLIWKDEFGPLCAHVFVQRFWEFKRTQRELHVCCIFLALWPEWVRQTSISHTWSCMMSRLDLRARLSCYSWSKSIGVANIYLNLISWHMNTSRDFG